MLHPSLRFFDTVEGSEPRKSQLKASHVYLFLGSLIISNEHGLVLTIDSDNNIVVAKENDNLFNQDWSLLETGK